MHASMLVCSITPKTQGSSVDPFHTIDDTDETIVFIKGLMKCISHLVDFLDISLIMNGLLRYVTVQYGGSFGNGTSWYGTE